MTIMDAINRIDSLKPNRYEQGEKIKWLNTLDQRVMAEIITTHENNLEKEFTGYNEETSLNTVLLVPSPHDDIYLYWMEAQIDYWNGEYGKYNNSIVMFNNAYDSYFNYYNRTNKAKSKKTMFF